MVDAGFKYRFYPSPEQENYLARTFGCVRVVYNRALDARKNHYAETGKALNYGKTSALLTAWKKIDGYRWLREVSSVPLQQTLRHLNAAYQRFFEKKAGYPRYKSRHDKQSATFVKSRFRLSGDLRQPQVQLPKMAEPLSIRWSRDLPSEPTSITITKDKAGRYFISFHARVSPQTATVAGGISPRTKAIGLDMGLTHTVITSDGEKIDNPRYYRRSPDRLRREQRNLSRKQKGSNNRAKQRLKVARLHARIADMRRDWSHKLTTDLVRRYDVICIETLNVKGMLGNPCLAQSIADVAWAEIKRQLRYKCQWYGSRLVEISQWEPTSKTCSACGEKRSKLPLWVRAWVCDGCGVVHDRDVNAALNVKAVGLAVLASGLRVRPVAALAVAGGSG